MNSRLMMNLNDIAIPWDSHEEFLERRTSSTAASADGTVTVYFRNLEQELIRRICESHVVVGCVAWLTSIPILHALAGVSNGVSIIVSKEDFLRQDFESRRNFASVLRQQYDALKEIGERYQFGGLVGSLSVCSDPTMQPVRCVGNYNREKKPAFPRMHNKFLVFCEREEEEWGFHIKPRAVWTGSFNLTHNATMSLENAVVLTDGEIVSAYYREWEHIFGLSEPLDWESDWVAPEFRIGT